MGIICRGVTYFSLLPGISTGSVKSNRPFSWLCQKRTSVPELSKCLILFLGFPGLKLKCVHVNVTLYPQVPLGRVAIRLWSSSTSSGLRLDCLSGEKPLTLASEQGIYCKDSRETQGTYSQNQKNIQASGELRDTRGPSQLPFLPVLPGAARGLIPDALCAPSSCLPLQMSFLCLFISTWS